MIYYYPPIFMNLDIALSRNYKDENTHLKIN